MKPKPRKRGARISQKEMSIKDTVQRARDTDIASLVRRLAKLEKKVAALDSRTVGSRTIGYRVAPLKPGLCGSSGDALSAGAAKSLNRQIRDAFPGLYEQEQDRADI